MVSEHDVSTEDESNTVVENSASRPLANRKNSGKVPKKIHKAEREKLKRDHLNELFLELGQALDVVVPSDERMDIIVTNPYSNLDILWTSKIDIRAVDWFLKHDPARQNNGKASILGDATRLLRELLTQVECLKKENVALVTESSYVHMIPRWDVGASNVAKTGLDWLVTGYHPFGWFNWFNWNNWELVGLTGSTGITGNRHKKRAQNAGIYRYIVGAHSVKVAIIPPKLHVQES
ncbi:hypothetical protein ACLOJK_013039 [Asimina triloba]